MFRNKMFLKAILFVWLFASIYGDENPVAKRWTTTGNPSKFIILGDLDNYFMNKGEQYYDNYQKYLGGVYTSTQMICIKTIKRIRRYQINKLTTCDYDIYKIQPKDYEIYMHKLKGNITTNIQIIAAKFQLDPLTKNYTLECEIDLFNFNDSGIVFYETYFKNITSKVQPNLTIERLKQRTDINNNNSMINKSDYKLQTESDTYVSKLGILNITFNITTKDFNKTTPVEISTMPSTTDSIIYMSTVTQNSNHNLTNSGENFINITTETSNTKELNTFEPTITTPLATQPATMEKGRNLWDVFRNLEEQRANRITNQNQSLINDSIGNTTQSTTTSQPIVPKNTITNETSVANNSLDISKSNNQTRDVTKLFVDALAKEMLKEKYTDEAYTSMPQSFNFNFDNNSEFGHSPEPMTTTSTTVSLEITTKAN